MALQFSKDGKYFAYISTDGKLKIWDTISNNFEQEFTPDYHLTSPCTCLHFLPSNSDSNTGASPKKKKRRESNSNLCPNIVLGSTSGLLLVYSIANANLECTINSQTSQSINCLSTIDSSIVYSGADQDVFIWNLQKQKLLKKWKGGNEKISSVLAIPDSNQILTASKNVKLWDVDTKEVLQVFTGHSSDVIFLQYINPRESEGAYFISGSKGDRLLSCWSLSSNGSSKNAVASFLMEDIVQNVSVNIARNGSTNLAATVRSGVVHIYRHTLNGKCNKPFKPKTTLQVVSDTGQSNEVVTPIRIIGAIYRDDETLCLGYGTEILLTFENVEISAYKKVQCLVRKDPRTVSISKEDQTLKTRTPVVNDSVQYLTPLTSSVATTKRKSEGTMEIPMEKRLENLTLNKSDLVKGVPKVDNLSQLLIQGLHSKDQDILRTVLYRKDDSVIRNTVKRLPVSALIPLIQELTQLLKGKTLASQIGSLWLKHVLQVHGSILMSNPELQELLAPMIGSIENRLTLLTPLHRLKGRLGLLISQVSSSSDSAVQGFNENEEPLLIFDDKDSSESDEEDLNK
ncbi:WD repeat-containing protein 43 [Anoplophora glabripennis]|uniref:WD repeat-containing protein 43 n=1 Tax=Anoplophora glabripennis TaxID=217634 RepID=UPI0008749ADB|nr:WD repeat-containing protein 43 [Anoplophora glabripennis]